MVKSISRLKRKAGMTSEEFHRYFGPFEPVDAAWTLGLGYGRRWVP